MAAPFNVLVGGMFYSPWKSFGALGAARLIHNKYALEKPPRGDDFVATATGQWTSRYQRFSREGTALVYNAAAFTYLADGKPLPLMHAANWGFPLGCGAGYGWGKGKVQYHPAGSADFLNKKFMDDFSYYAAPKQARTRLGASNGAKPANATFSSIRFYSSSKYEDSSPLLNGMRIRLGRGLYSKVGGDGKVWFNDECFSCSTEWRITKVTKTVARQADIEPDLPGRGISLPNTGPGATAGSLASTWKPFGGECGSPVFRKLGNLVVLDGMILGNGKHGQVANLPRGSRPNGTLIFNANNHAVSARVNIAPNGQVTWSAGGGTNGGWLSLAGINFSTDRGKALTLVNGWRAYGQGFVPPTATKTGNVVTLSGLMRGGKYGHLANLPKGYAPPGRLIFSVNDDDTQARVDVLPNG